MISGLISKVLDIDSNELRAVLSSFLLVSLLMGSYYMLRPIRDSLASEWSDTEVSLLWTFTFIFSAVAVLLYGYVASKIRFDRLVSSVYGAFAVCFVLFYFSTSNFHLEIFSNKSFYVLVSVYSLFHVSVFWSLMSEVFSKAQAKRLFGFIGAGASTGAVLGPLTAALLAGSIGNQLLLLGASLIIIATIPLILFIQARANSEFSDSDSKTSPSKNASIGGTTLDGFKFIFSERLLLGIALFIFLATTLSSLIYFEIKNILSGIEPDARTQIWAGIDFVVNILAITIGAFVTGRITKMLGLSFSLSLVPGLLIFGFIFLAANPVVAVVVVLQVIRRAGQYSITRPAREMLFTAVGREVRFKSKPIIDVVLYRGGDMISAWVITGFTQGLGLGLSAMAGLGAIIATIWTGLGFLLGREFLVSYRSRKKE